MAGCDCVASVCEWLGRVIFFLGLSIISLANGAKDDCILSVYYLI